MIAWIKRQWARLVAWWRRLWSSPKTKATTATIATVTAVAAKLILSPVPPVDCDAWAASLQQIEQSTTVVFVGVRTGYSPPNASSERRIGTCVNGVCTIMDATCPASYTYTYETAGPVRVGPNDWDVWRITTAVDVAAAWRQLGDEDPQVFFGESYKGVRGRLNGAGLTAAQGRAVLDQLGVSWDRGDGDICVGGLLYGPGKGGVDTDGNALPCSPRAGDTPYPRHNPVGRGWEQTITATDWADIETPPVQGDGGP